MSKNTSFRCLHVHWIVRNVQVSQVAAFAFKYPEWGQLFNWIVTDIQAVCAWRGGEEPNIAK